MLRLIKDKVAHLVGRVYLRHLTKFKLSPSLSCGRHTFVVIEWSLKMSWLSQRDQFNRWSIDCQRTSDYGIITHLRPIILRVPMVSLCIDQLSTEYTLRLMYYCIFFLLTKDCIWSIGRCYRFTHVVGSRLVEASERTTHKRSRERIFLARIRQAGKCCERGQQPFRNEISE